VQKWAESFVSILERPQTMGHRTRSVTPQINHQIATAYRQTKHRLLLLDYDGVLRRLARTPEAAVPTAQLTGLLRRLSQDPANEIVIVSGRSKADLLKWFGDLPVALAAEHGALFRRRGGKNWHRMSGSDRTWLPEVTRLFKQYAALTPGALVEQKEWSTAWHYRTASPYYSQKHLVALRRLLKPILARNHLALEEGHKVLEVRPASINKGRIVQEWAIHDHDFVLAAGDDATDEAMFGVLPPGAYSLKVGRGRTLANYRLGSVSDTLHLLERLSP
jgi:trehalose 6-phosphate synthase/phosphatase